MLKIIRKENDSVHGDDNLALAESWVMVRTSPRNPWSSMPLPLTLGFGVDNDIYVNAPTMRPVSKVLASVGGLLTVIDAQSHARSESSQLSLFGIELMGPFSEDPSKMAPFKRAFEQLKHREALAYLRYPKVLQSVLPQKQSTRVTAVTAVAAGLALLLALGDGSGNVNPDLSATARSVAAGNIVDVSIQSTGANSSYAKGATFALKDVEKSSSHQYVLTLSLTGLDVADELMIYFNDKLIGQTAASLNCVDSICQRDFSVDESLLIESGNTIKVSHADITSSYLIKSVFFRGMEPASDEDRESVQQLLVSAERYYDERLLLVQNIRNASDAISQVENVLGTRTGLDALKPRVSVAKKKITDAFKETSSDLQFKLKKELSLGHGKQAIAIINDMLKLYPDPATKQYMMLVAQKKKLQEAEK